MEIVFFIAETEVAPGSHSPTYLLRPKICGCFPTKEAPAEAGQFGIYELVSDQT